MSTKAKSKPAFRAVSVVSRNKKNFFVDIGAAWALEKGGYSVRLNALPIGDTILLLPSREKDAAEESAAEAAADAAG